MLDVVASFNEEEQNTLLCCFHCVLLPLQMNFSMYSLLIAFLLVASASSFVPQRNLNVCRSTRLHKTTDDFQSDFPPEEEAYKGDVDWDAEWKKVLANKDQPKERPGKDFCTYPCWICAMVFLA